MHLLINRNVLFFPVACRMLKCNRCYLVHLNVEIRVKLSKHGLLYDEIYSTRKEQKKRMHSSRMCTARTLPYGQVSVMEIPPGQRPPGQRPPGKRPPPGQRPLREQNNTEGSKHYLSGNYSKAVFSQSKIGVKTQ